MTKINDKWVRLLEAWAKLPENKKQMFHDEYKDKYQVNENIGNEQASLLFAMYQKDGYTSTRSRLRYATQISQYTRPIFEIIREEVGHGWLAHISDTIIRSWHEGRAKSSTKYPKQYELVTEWWSNNKHRFGEKQ